jgi:hypothetical protein
MGEQLKTAIRPSTTQLIKRCSTSSILTHSHGVQSMSGGHVRGWSFIQMGFWVPQEFGLGTSTLGACPSSIQTWLSLNVNNLTYTFSIWIIKYYTMFFLSKKICGNSGEKKVLTYYDATCFAICL